MAAAATAAVALAEEVTEKGAGVAVARKVAVMVDAATVDAATVEVGKEVVMMAALEREVVMRVVAVMGAEEMAVTVRVAVVGETVVMAAGELERC